MVQWFHRLFRPDCRTTRPRRYGTYHLGNPRRLVSTMPATRPELDILDPGIMHDVIVGSLRLTPDQALRLYHRMPIHELGRWADARCKVLHGERIRTYVI